LLDFFRLHLVGILLVLEALLETLDLLFQVLNEDRSLVEGKAGSLKPLNFDVFFLGNDHFFVIIFLVSDLLLK
jgi:hypothetical protein